MEFNSKKNENNVEIRNNSIIIKNVNRNHIGAYQCYAVNVLGKSFSEIVNLNVKCKFFLPFSHLLHLDLYRLLIIRFILLCFTKCFGQILLSNVYLEQKQKKKNLQPPSN